MPEISAGDTAWVLMSAALVMLMTPGLALFYGGLVRSKNVLSTIMHSFFILALVSVTWVLWGYTLAFGPDTGLGLIGGLDWLGLDGVTGEPSSVYATTVPHLAFMAFQMMFAIITPALITGAFAERKRFKAFVLFAVIWSTLVYAPIAHWVWSPDGWLFGLGVLDFAGGTVVHLSSGVAALVAALFIGRRAGLIAPATEPHDVPMTILGAGLLWFGWFGFNAGSALAANGLAATAFVTTNTAAAMAALTWVTLSWLHRGTPSVLGAAIGAVAGLVAITPAAGYVTPGGSRPHRHRPSASSAMAPRSCACERGSTTPSTCSASMASAALSVRWRPASSRRSPSTPAASMASWRATPASSLVQALGRRRGGPVLGGRDGRRSSSS